MADRKDRIQTRTRMYDDINQDILESMPILAPNWTSHGSDEPGQAVLQILAAVSDSLFFNLDRRSRENFLTTAVLPESIHDLASMLHYRPKRWIAAEAELLINVPNYDAVDDADLPIRPNYTVPALTAINLKDNSKAVILDEIIVPTEYSGMLSIPLLEGTYKTFTATISPENLFALVLPNENIAEQLFEVYISNELWFDATDHPLNSDIDNFYYITKNAEGLYQINFRTSRGRIPQYGDLVEVRYLVTTGVNLDAGIIDTNNTPIAESGFTWTYTDFTDASQPETLQEIRDRAPAKNSTSDRAVTLDDYRELAKQLPNVKSVYVTKSKIGWSTVEIYVATKDGVPASQEQLITVKEFFEKRNNLVTAVRTLPANFKRFNMTLSIRVKNNFNSGRVINEVRSILEKEFSYASLTFASAIRISDVYAIVEAVNGVDYSNLQELYWITNSPGLQNLVAIESEYPILQNLTVTLE